MSEAGERTHTLSVPTEGLGKKNRPKSPRKKAPTAPKKKKRSPRENDGSNVLSGTSEDSKQAERSLKRSVSPRKEQYTSLLEETVGKGDMVLLDPITEDAIMENLKTRYASGEIYVSS